MHIPTYIPMYIYIYIYINNYTYMKFGPLNLLEDCFAIHVYNIHMYSKAIQYIYTLYIYTHMYSETSAHKQSALLRCSQFYNEKCVVELLLCSLLYLSI